MAREYLMPFTGQLLLKEEFMAFLCTYLHTYCVRKKQFQLTCIEFDGGSILFTYFSFVLDVVPTGIEPVSKV